MRCLLLKRISRARVILFNCKGVELLILPQETPGFSGKEDIRKDYLGRIMKEIEKLSKKAKNKPYWI